MKGVLLINGYNTLMKQTIQRLQSSGLTYAPRLTDRLLYLIHPPTEDKDEDWPEVNVESLTNLVDFFVDGKNFFVPNKRPLVSVTAGGTLRAEWRGENGRFLGLEFLPKFTYRYVIFSPSREKTNHTNRKIGLCGRKRLEELIGSFNWLK